MKKFYRYRDRQTNSYSFDECGEMVLLRYSTIEVELTEFDVVKKTPKGIWIQEVFGEWGYTDKKWISESSKFAWNTKEKAMISFKKRKESQIKILKSQLKRSETALRMAETGKEDSRVIIYAL